MGRLNKSILLAMGLVLIFTLLVRHASPIKDGDFYWHSAYAKYMIENKTLIPDHTIFSWTPTDNTKIKNNWFSEILLYLMYSAGGLNLLFAFKYACYAFLLSLLITLTLKINKKIEPFFLFFHFIALFSSASAAYIKPELFSLLYFATIYFIYFSAKHHQTQGHSTRALLGIPLIFILWINSHEVVLFGLIAFGAIYFGELLNYFFNSKVRPTKDFIHHLSMASIGTAGVIFINPYGYKFPLNLVSFLRRSGDTTLGGIEAYNSIFFSSFSKSYYFDYWIIMAVSLISLLAYLLWKKKICDWAIILPTIFLSALYLKYARATYYWPPFWAMSMIYLSGHLKGEIKINTAYKKAASVLSCVLLILLSVRIVDTAVRKPFLGQHFGFGPGYNNPVQSVEFLKTYRPGSRLYNSYGVGGFLTFALYPVYQVFMDNRFFPYASWYQEYYDFSHGKTGLKEFSEKYPFDVAVVDYHYSKPPINEFIGDKEWHPVFYGTSAAVFVKKETGFKFDPASNDPSRFESLGTIFQAYTVFNFAQNIGDWKTAEYLFELMQSKFSYMKDYDSIIYLSTLSFKGLQAMRNGNYESADTMLEQYGLKPFMRTTNQAILNLRSRKIKGFMEKNELESALAILEKTLVRLPEHLSSRYNAGVIGYMMERRKKNSHSLGDGRWRLHLEKVIEIAQHDQASRIARMLLDGDTNATNIPLMF